MPLTQHNIRKMRKQSPSAHRCRHQQHHQEKTQQQQEDDQLSHSSCSSLAPLSPQQQQPINLKSEVSQTQILIEISKCENEKRFVRELNQLHMP